MCCVVMVEEAGDAAEPLEGKVVTETVDWRGIAFGLARFARHRPECHQHPFDRPCHCGYEEVWAEFKRREREYYLASIEPVPVPAVVVPKAVGSAGNCRGARGKKGKTQGVREV